MGVEPVGDDDADGGDEQAPPCTKIGPSGSEAVDQGERRVAPGSAERFRPRVPAAAE